jgi:hypothetical protein
VEKYLPSLGEALDPGFYVERDALKGRDPADSDFTMIPIDTPAIADLIAKADRTIVF